MCLINKQCIKSIEHVHVLQRFKNYSLIFFKHADGAIAV